VSYLNQLCAHHGGQCCAVENERGTRQKGRRNSGPRATSVSAINRSIGVSGARAGAARSRTLRRTLPRAEGTTPWDRDASWPPIGHATGWLNAKARHKRLSQFTKPTQVAYPSRSPSPTIAMSPTKGNRAPPVGRHAAVFQAPGQFDTEMLIPSPGRSARRLGY
jgi:hypothetical protein